MVSFGTLGLIEAFERFDIDRGLKFETYAVARIRGSIIDQLRYFDGFHAVFAVVPKNSKKPRRSSSKSWAALQTRKKLATAMGVTTTRLKTIITESKQPDDFAR